MLICKKTRFPNLKCAELLELVFVEIEESRKLMISWNPFRGEGHICVLYFIYIPLECK